jgi:hypothetical protein
VGRGGLGKEKGEDARGAPGGQISLDRPEGGRAPLGPYGAHEQRGSAEAYPHRGVGYARQMERGAEKIFSLFFLRPCYRVPKPRDLVAQRWNLTTNWSALLAYDSVPTVSSPL